MKMYSGILKILDEKGPLPISILCSEANRMMKFEKPVNQQEIQTFLKRKNELFSINNEVISIKPCRQLEMIEVYSQEAGKAACQIRVDFRKDTFMFLEWRDKANTIAPFASIPGIAGNLADFKEMVYTLNIWDWNDHYKHGEGIILDGKTWTVRLRTKAAIYRRTGDNEFPNGWSQFRKSLNQLTGTSHW